MRLSTKIFLAIYIVCFVPGAVLSKYIFEGIKATDKGFTFSFGTPAIIGLCFMGVSIIFGTICYIRFLRILKLSKVLFFSITPMTVLYGLGIYLLADFGTLPKQTAIAVRAILNISAENKYNSILWAILLTLIYILISFVLFSYVCRPIQKIERVTSKLGDGRITEGAITIGKTKQFHKIEDSLERINYNYKEKENRVKQADLEAQKFIPKQFLKFLGKGSISELELGNQVQKRATTLFCDLLSSTTVSTTLSLEENFNFINSYLNIISPLVRKYDGFVDKYLGDGILAVFPRAERAIDCAHAIIRAIEVKNKSQKDLPNVDTKISINTGDIVFGIVGEEERKAPTIISDVVNLASKIEDINKFMGTKIVFSKQTLNEIPEKYNLHYRYIGSLTLDGEETALPLFESLEIYPKDEKDKLVRLKNKFENGVRSYNDGQFKVALQTFQEVLKYLPNDKPSYIYFNKANEKLKEVEL